MCGFQAVTGLGSEQMNDQKMVDDSAASKWGEFDSIGAQLSKIHNTHKRRKKTAIEMQLKLY